MGAVGDREQAPVGLDVNRSRNKPITTRRGIVPDLEPILQPCEIRIAQTVGAASDEQSWSCERNHALQEVAALVSDLPVVRLSAEDHGFGFVPMPVQVQNSLALSVEIFKDLRVIRPVDHRQIEFFAQDAVVIRRRDEASGFRQLLQRVEQLRALRDQVAERILEPAPELPALRSAEAIGDLIGSADPLGGVALKSLALPCSPCVIAEAILHHAFDAGFDQGAPIRRVRVRGFGDPRATDDERLRAARNFALQIVEERHRTACNQRRAASLGATRYPVQGRARRRVTLRSRSAPSRGA